MIIEIFEVVRINFSGITKNAYAFEKPLLSKSRRQQTKKEAKSQMRKAFLRTQNQAEEEARTRYKKSVCLL